MQLSFRIVPLHVWTKFSQLIHSPTHTHTHIQISRKVQTMAAAVHRVESCAQSWETDCGHRISPTLLPTGNGRTQWQPQQQNRGVPGLMHNMQNTLNFHCIRNCHPRLRLWPQLAQCGAPDDDDGWVKIYHHMQTRRFPGGPSALGQHFVHLRGTESRIGCVIATGTWN